MNNIRIKFGLPDYKDLLRYGEIESDLELKGRNGIHTRIYKIRYMGILYHLKMTDGEVTTLIQWDSFVYNEDANDISNFKDDEIDRLLMFADRDRKINGRAEVVYWLCVKEINKRIEESD